MDSSLHCIKTLQRLLRDKGDLNAISDCLQRLPFDSSESATYTSFVCDLISSIQWLRLSQNCFQLCTKHIQLVPSSTLIQAFHMLLLKHDLDQGIVVDAADLFIELFLQDSARFHQLFSDPFVDKRRISCCALIVKALAALPTMFANAGQGIVRPELAPQAFFSKFCTYAVSYLKKNHSANLFMMSVIAKLARSGSTELIVAELVNSCLIPNEAWQLVAVSEYCIIFEKTATYGLNSACKPNRVLQTFLPQNIVNAHPSLIRTISRLFLDKTLSKNSLYALVLYLSQHADRTAFVNTFEEIASVWSATSKSKNLSIIQQASLSQAVILFLERSTQTELNASSTLVSQILNGVQDRLRSPTADIRIMGMRAGEALSSRLTPDQPLIFTNEEDEDGSVNQEIHVDFGLGLDLCLSYFEESSSSNSQESQATPPVSSEANDVSWIHGDRLPDDDEFETVKDKLDIAVAHGADDGIMPPKQVPAPRFLRECLDYLREKKPFDSREYFECALESIPSVIQAEPYDLRSLSVSLALHILNLHNKYATAQFDFLQRKALVAIASSSPDNVSPQMIRAFYSSNFTISNRLLVLDVLADSAKFMSKLCASPPSIERGDGAKLLPIRELQPTSLEISARIESKTRRWGRRQYEPILGINKFAIYADSLLFNLLSPQEEIPFRLYTDDAVVLVRLLHVAGIIVECGGVSASFKASLDNLFKLLWSVRGHETVSVRLASLFALSRILLFQGTFVSFTEDAKKFTDVSEWLHEAYSHDSESDVRNLALFSIRLLSNR